MKQTLDNLGWLGEFLKKADVRLMDDKQLKLCEDLGRAVRERKDEMAKVKTSNRKLSKTAKKSTKKKAVKKVGRRGKKPVKEFELHFEKTTPSKDIRDYSILCHGEKKIGKTTLFAQEPGAYFITWDPPQEALAIRQDHPVTWDDMLSIVKQLESLAKRGKLRIKTIIVDGVDLMYDCCFDWICKKLAINHPHDVEDYGDSWRQIKRAFRGIILRLLAIPGTAIRFISHSQWKEIKTRGQGTVDKLVPFLTGQAEEALVGEVDIWAAYVYDKDKRVLLIEGDEEIAAGHRVDQQFRDADGNRLEEIDMGNSPEEAYANLVAAFDNAVEPKKKAVKKKAKKTSKKKKATKTRAGQL